MADPSPQQWAAAVLGRLGIHQTPGAVQALAGWARAEGGHWHNDARFNPLNTTQPAPGAGNTGTQGNIKVYRSWGQGINATAQTLTNGRYGNILAALKAGDPARVASAIGQSPWGTSAATARSAILGTPQVSGVDGTALLHDAAHDHLSGMVGVQLAHTKTFDQAGFDQARREFVLGSMIARHEPDSILLKSGVLSTSAPNPADFESSRLTSKTITSGGGGSPSGGGGSAAADGGTQRVDGKPVAAWIAPILQYAKQQGWKGTVQSGYRSVAEQARIYNSGVRPAAKPGQSNHNFTAFPGGAIDVSDAAHLAEILKRSPYAKKLVWAGGKDPVHFSHPRNGTY